MAVAVKFDRCLNAGSGRLTESTHLKSNFLVFTEILLLLHRKKIERKGTDAVPFSFIRA